MFDLSSLALSMPTGFQTAVDSISSESAGAMAALGVFFIVLVFVAIIVGIAVYIYSSLALMAIAKKTGTEPGWLAWVPFGNLYLVSKIAGMHWWPILLLVGYIVLYVAYMVLSMFSSVLGLVVLLFSYIPLIAFSIFQLIWWWKICEARNRPGWLVLFTLIPFLGGLWNLVLMGMLAWSDE